MSDISSYLNQGVQAAGQARDIVGYNWADSWKNFATQYALQQQANENEVSMWNLMNEYNSPVNQMARFKEAGLNPMLIYQQGTPGNASSAPGTHVASAQIHPQQDIGQQISMANNVISMVSNLAQNVMGIFNAGYDTEIKRNEAAFSNLEYASAASRIAGFGQGRNVDPKYRFVDLVGPDGQLQQHFPMTLNPYSDQFSPVEYNLLAKLGKIPDYFRGYMTAEPQRELYQFKGEYQDYYNEHLLPLFERYQTGKATSSEIQAEIDQYNKIALEMLPPEVRGLLAPVVQYLSPFLKFIFKRNSLNVNRK